MKDENKIVKEHHYEGTYDNNRNGVVFILTRDDGLKAISTRWNVDDGSAETEAYAIMRNLEKE